MDTLLDHQNSYNIRCLLSDSMTCIPGLAMQSLAALVIDAAAELMLQVKVVKMVPQHLQAKMSQS